MAGGEPGGKPLQVENEGRGIDRHVEDRRRQREPGLLKSPERPHRTPHPPVEAAFGRHCRSQLAQHQSGGKAPQKGEKKQQQQSAAISAIANDVFNIVRTARHHKVGGGEQRKEAQLARAAERLAWRYCLAHRYRMRIPWSILELILLPILSSFPASNAGEAA